MRIGRSIDGTTTRTPLPVAATACTVTRPVSRAATYALWFVIVCLVGGRAVAQTVVDRVVARVNGAALLLSDVRAATAVGVVTGEGDEAVERTIERALLLAEVARFPPPEPAEAAVDAEAARLGAAAGPALGRRLDAIGLPASTVREMARDTLRIQAYLDQRFGVTVPLTDDQALEYYRTHADAFRRGGALAPFLDVEPEVRRLAAQERRATAVGQWLRDLRLRAEITQPPAAR